ncbi:thymidine phosphorylase [Kordiimonas marina]|uniref:thymidine phosphorylase n=1 Tax=Kordiimonas marina TaxID=2872312 RepID=UPI001FF21DD6|nr:thymidine phosphorylase [Kordiimonas marina]MCJ9427684.1 thymidine phosphorylase [Kordiimonas marina]
MTFLPQEMIRTKRDGGTVSSADIQAFVRGITDMSVTDGQVAAFAMAVFFNGMSPEEGAALTLAMRDSGDVIDWSKYGLDKEAPIVDKHSTGGVGDKVSLMLAPIVAACGGLVPMISGRGLGHTGGTLDKFEAIPGYDPYPSIDRFAEIVKTVGCSIIGQTGDLAPADRRFYGIRDVTATVESVPLITASILSKKLAAGLNALVMDVKFGTGAFMDSADKARVLAENIVRVATAAGVPTTALMTDMNQVLGRTAGNAVEVMETLAFLKDPAGADKRLMDITLDLAAHMLSLSGAQADASAARKAAEEALASGKATEIFGRMVSAQGGPADFLEKADSYLTLAPVVKPVTLGEGYVSAMDARAIGMAVVALGGGRTDPSQKVDHSVGFTEFCQVGDKLTADQPALMVYAQDEAAADAAIERVRAAVTLSDTAPALKPITAEIIEG